MSYILDALRRAEAQRQQQTPTPPGLGTPTAVPTVPPRPSGQAAPLEPKPVGRHRIAWVVAAALTGVLLALALAGPPAPTTPTPTSSATTDPDPGPAPRPTPQPIASTADAPEPMLQPRPEPAPQATSPAAGARPVPASTPVLPYADLPDAVRAGLPAISVQGVTWSENPALRQLIVNGRVLQEGQSIGPDHVLEQIGRDGSVLRFRGQRYRIGH